MHRLKKLSYSIESVASLTGLSAYTLRNWERRFGVPKPQRRDNSYRSYDIADVKILRQIAALLGQGHKINELMAAVAKGEALPAVSQIEPSPLRLSQLEILYKQLTGFNAVQAELTLSNLMIGLSPRVYMDAIYQPILERLGGEWSTGKICIAQEHFTSAFMRHHMSPLLFGGASQSRSKKVALFAALETELHEAGLMMIAIQLKFLGWAIYYLGTNLPVSEIKIAADAIEPQAICLSCSDAGLFERSLQALESLPFMVCVGGSGLKSVNGELKLPKNVISFDTSAKEAAELIDCLGLEYFEQFRKPKRAPRKTPIRVVKKR